MVTIEFDKNEFYEIEKMFDFQLGALCERALRLEGILAMTDEERPDLKEQLKKYQQAIKTVSSIVKKVERARKNS